MAQFKVGDYVQWEHKGFFDPRGCIITGGGNGNFLIETVSGNRVARTADELRHWCQCSNKGGDTYCTTPGHRRQTAQPDTYAAAGKALGELVDAKQAAYGNSFGKSGAIMRILYPSGISADKLNDALTIVRVLDKLFRVATDNDPTGESPWRDIAGYALLASERK